jgi:hypothetical protein
MKIATPNQTEISAIRKKWEIFYKEVFNLTVDFSQVKIPHNDGILNFLQFMAPGLTYPQMHYKEKDMYSGCFDVDNSWPYKMHLRFEEATDIAKAIWHSGNYEPEDNYADKSADWILENQIKTMTCLQRGVFGLFVYWDAKVMIDKVFSTYCTGSRYVYACVPRVGVGIFGLEFDWVDSNDANGNWRPRCIIS